MVPEKRSQCHGMANLWCELKKRVIDGKEAVQRQEPGGLCKGGMGQNPGRDMEESCEQIQEPFRGCDQEHGLCH